MLLDWHKKISFCNFSRVVFNVWLVLQCGGDGLDLRPQIVGRVEVGSSRCGTSAVQQ